jgi:CRISPR-associated protein Cmr6
MRNVLRPIVGIKPGLHEDDVPKLTLPDHFGLAYGAWAPMGERGALGKVPDHWRDAWFDSLSGIKIPADYTQAFKHWHGSFTSADRLAVFELDARLLLGHGNASATEVGLTVHRTWGVPFLPGSAIKGLLAHYVDATLGPDWPRRAPYDGGSPEATERARYQSPAFDERRIALGPGDVYRTIFGAPDADDDETARQKGRSAGASRGWVVFHDALCIPPGFKTTVRARAGSGAGEGLSDGATAGRTGPERKETEGPFKPDVLTVHQKTYYRTAIGSSSSGQAADSVEPSWPNDYDCPNPVGFLTVRRGVRFLLALSGPPEWLRLLEPLLAAALRDWGVGGKTSAGYGRGTVDKASAKGFGNQADEGGWFSPKAPASDVLRAFIDYVQTAPREGSEAQWQGQILESIEARWLNRLAALDSVERQEAKVAVERAIKPKKKAVEKLRDQIVARLLLDEPGVEGAK